MHHIFGFRQSGMWLRPGRPAVCFEDIFGFAITAVLLIAYMPEFGMAVLPLAIMMQYAISCAYHWFPQSDLLCRLDHMTIFFVITMTFIPFLVTLLPSWYAALGIAILGFLTVYGANIKWRSYLGRSLSAKVYAGVAVVGLIAALPAILYLKPIWQAGFWIGVIFYLIQLVIYTRESPDPLPTVLGFRGLQHLFLLIATTLHTLVVLHLIRE